MVSPLSRSSRPAATGDVPGGSDFLGTLNSGLARNSNALIGLGSGLLSGDTFATGLAMGGSGWRGGAEQDDAYATAERERKKREETVARTAAAVRSMGTAGGNLAEMIESGAIEPGEGYWKAMEYQRAAQSENQALARNRGNASYLTDPALKAAVESGQMDFGDAYKMQLAGSNGGDAPTVVEIFDPNTGMPQKGYMQGSNFVPLGGTKAAPGTTGDLSATETRELFSTEENIQAANNVISALDTALDLNDKSASGWGAEQFAGIGANLPDWVPGLGGNETRDANTLQLKNVVTEQALSQLKLTFGAAPTEGERQILLDIQGSVNQPQEVRKRIFDRAKELAIKRLQFNEGKKQRIQAGAYGSVQQPGQQPALQGGADQGAAPTAVNPTTGERVVWDGQSWVSAQ